MNQFLCLTLGSLLLLILSCATLSLAATTQKSPQICRALALGGGGDRGAYEAGVIKALVALLPAEQVRYDVVTGISAGSINAAGFSQFALGQEKQASQFLVDQWLRIKRTDIYKNWIPGGIVEGFALKSGLLDTSPLRSTLKQLLNLENVKNSGRRLHVGATNLNQASVQFFNETSSNLIDGIMASSAVPGVFPAVIINGESFVDGGVEYMDAISDSVRLCFDKYDNDTSIQVQLDVILAISDVGYPKFLDAFKTTPFILTQSLFTMANNILIADIQNTKVAFPKTKVRVFKPSSWLPGWFLGFSSAEEMIQRGYDDAVKILKESH